MAKGRFQRDAFSSGMRGPEKSKVAAKPADDEQGEEVPGKFYKTKNGRMIFHSADQKSPAQAVPDKK